MTTNSRPMPLPQETPQFQSEQEEASYWAQHDTAALMAAAEDVSETPPAELKVGLGRRASRAKKRPGRERMKLISLYLPEDLIEAVKTLAVRDDVAYQALIRSWVRERLKQELLDVRRITLSDDLLEAGTNRDALQQQSEQLLLALKLSSQSLAGESSVINTALAALLNAQQHELRVQQRESLLIEAIYAALAASETAPQGVPVEVDRRGDDDTTVAADASAARIRR